MVQARRPLGPTPAKFPTRGKTVVPDADAATPLRSSVAPGDLASGDRGGDGPDPQDIETLRGRYEAFNKAKTVAETKLEHAQAKLEELKLRARESWGTDDLEELRALLESKRRENREQRERYQGSLDAIEKDLDAIDKKYGEAQGRGVL